MRLISMKLKNFRGYKDEIAIEFDNLTTFVGKNDIGKSTILEALDIFFNDGGGTVKLDKGDINKQAELENDNTITISACFDELPERVVIDATNETSLQAEYLLNSNSKLEIVKRYPNAGKEKVFIKAYHPTNENCNDLLLKKDRELRSIIDQSDIDCEDRSTNATMRSSIWNHFGTDLQLGDIEIDVTKGETKSIWSKVQTYLPLFVLFQSDRKNSDSDSEVQDPLKEAVKFILQDEELSQKLNEVADVVGARLQNVSNNTLEKLREMDTSVAETLNPVIPTSDKLKWADVFKNVSIAGDNDIPINKRGSGVKRLILLNFFRAEAERRSRDLNSGSIIYAVEEPETSQHTSNQRMLIEAFIRLAEVDNTQIIITTHSASIVKALDYIHLRLIRIDEGMKCVNRINQGQLPYPSLNEVNFQAFSEVTEEYHNELYGYIDAEGHLTSFRTGKPTINYVRVLRDGATRNEQIILTDYIRHQIHHPENTHNVRFTLTQLGSSINLMRDFIQNLT